MRAQFFVLGIQLAIMLVLIYSMIHDPTFHVNMPKHVSILIARFLAVIIMHMVVEKDLRQGLMVMKFAANHPYDEHDHH